MRLFILLICLSATLGCAQMRLKCYIQPEVAAIPASGQVPFDVSWVNDTNQTIRLSAITGVTFLCEPIPPEISGGGGGGNQLQIPERVIPPHSTVHDKVTGHFFPYGAKSVAITATFSASPGAFRTNTVVLQNIALRNPPVRPNQTMQPTASPRTASVVDD
jgi:hypothetical protein